MITPQEVERIKKNLVICSKCFLALKVFLNKKIVRAEQQTKRASNKPVLDNNSKLENADKITITNIIAQITKQYR